MSVSKSGAYPGGRFGVTTPPLMEIFFNLSRVFREKNPTISPKFCRLYKKILEHHPQIIPRYAPGANVSNSLHVLTKNS